MTRQEHLRQLSELVGSISPAAGNVLRTEAFMAEFSAKLDEAYALLRELRPAFPYDSDGRRKIDALVGPEQPKAQEATPGGNEDDRQAVVMYTVAERDTEDFLDMLPTATEGTLKTLYLMLTTPNPEMSERNRRVNAAFEPVVKAHMEYRGFALPEPVSPPPLDPRVDHTKVQLAGGGPVTADHRELKENGQQKGYIVLSPEERQKGFVRPVRRDYVHVGRRACGKLVKNDGSDKLGGSVRVCLMPPDHEGECGAKWIEASQPQQAEAERTHRFGGCGVRTVMSRDIAETYARDPKFYNGTFCCGCSTHLPLDEFVWDGTEEQVGS